MSGPSWGVSLPLGSAVGETARLAEQLDFDYVTVGEHLAFHGPSANGFVSLAAAAGATSTIGLLSSVTLLPLYPAMLAKLVASLDDVSGGRFTLGVGIGGENEGEFDAVGVSKRERGARTDEAIVVLRRLLAETDVHLDGSFTKLSGLTISPRPQHRLPVWVAGRSRAAMRRAANLGDGWMPYLYTPERLAESLEQIRAHATEAGSPPWQGRVAVHLFTTLDPDPVRARRTAVQHVGETYRQDFEHLADHYLLHGDAAACVRRVEEYLEAGADTVVLRLASAPGETTTMMRRIAEEVVAPLRTTGHGIQKARSMSTEPDRRSGVPSSR